MNRMAARRDPGADAGSNSVSLDGGLPTPFSSGPLSTAAHGRSTDALPTPFPAPPTAPGKRNRRRRRPPSASPRATAYSLLPPYFVNTNEKNKRVGPFAILKKILLRPFLKRTLRLASVML